MLELLDAYDELQATTKIEIDSESIASFQKNIAKPIVTNLKGNISRRFSSQDIVASFSIFDPSILICHLMGNWCSSRPLWQERAAKSIEGEEFIVPALVSPDIRTY